MYWNDLDLSKAIGFINRYEQQKKEIQARMEEQRKREQERELERERDRIRNEERARIRQEEQIKEEARLQAIKEQEAAKKAEIEAMAVQKLSNVTSMVFATFKVQATQEELGQIEMYMQSIGVDYERVD
jgi:ATPase subunit of ABC transporter with duplicated ATPase domains